MSVSSLNLGLGLFEVCLGIVWTSSGDGMSFALTRCQCKVCVVPVPVLLLQVPVVARPPFCGELTGGFRIAFPFHLEVSSNSPSQQENWALTHLALVLSTQLNPRLAPCLHSEHLVGSGILTRGTGNRFCLANLGPPAPYICRPGPILGAS